MERDKKRKKGGSQQIFSERKKSRERRPPKAAGKTKTQEKEGRSRKGDMQAPAMPAAD